MSSVNPKSLDTYSGKYPDFLGFLKRVVFRTNGRCKEFYFTRPRFNEEVGGWAFEMQLYQTLRVTNAQLITSTFRNVDGRASSPWKDGARGRPSMHCARMPFRRFPRHKGGWKNHRSSVPLAICLLSVPYFWKIFSTRFAGLVKSGLYVCPL